jgi:hypothetical protein
MTSLTSQPLATTLTRSPPDQIEVLYPNRDSCPMLINLAKFRTRFSQRIRQLCRYLTLALAQTKD